jgi:hypothetical protein
MADVMIVTPMTARTRPYTHTCIRKTMIPAMMSKTPAPVARMRAVILTSFSSQARPGSGEALEALVLACRHMSGAPWAALG